VIGPTILVPLVGVVLATPPHLLLCFNEPPIVW